MTVECDLHCESKKDIDVTHCNFNAQLHNAHQPILEIFSRDVAEEHEPGKHEPRGDSSKV